MKKLMIVAAIAMAVVGAQASAVKWTGSGVTDPVGGAVVSGGAVWVFYATDTTTASGMSGLVKTLAYNDAVSYVNKLADSATVSDALTALQNGAYKTTGKTTAAGGFTAMDSRTGTKNWSTGDSVSGYALIFDDEDVSKAEYVIITSLASSQNFTGANQTKTFSFGSQADATWHEIAAATPEPTSGLLVLFGLGALALRRRRA